MADNAPGNEAGSISALEPQVRDPAPDPKEGRPVNQPDIHKLGKALRERVEVRSLAITGLFVLAAFYTLYFARAFLLPIVVALLLDFLLSPIIRGLRRVGVPQPVGAALVLLALVGALGFAIYELAGPAKEWAARAPESLRRVEDRVRELRTPMERVTRTAEQVERATTVRRDGGPLEVTIKGPSFTERLFGTTQAFVAGALEVIVLLYFLLAVGDLFLQKLIKVLPAFHDKKTAVAIARETERSISPYLFTLTLVNLGLGLVVAAVMYLVGMPSPVLWGALAGLAEFIPYLGATALLIILTLAGLLTFDSLGHALLVPASYLAVQVIQANFVSPLVLGRRLTLNPVAILVGIVFWWWIWGIPGAFIAVPMLATFKIFCDHIEALAPIGEFLGD